jgi:hypothetical protein
MEFVFEKSKTNHKKNVEKTKKEKCFKFFYFFRNSLELFFEVWEFRAFNAEDFVKKFCEKFG